MWEYPRPPPARKHRLDSNLTTVQGKLEMGMQTLVHGMETGEREQLAQVGAWMRSAWEDLH